MDLFDGLPPPLPAARPVPTPQQQQLARGACGAASLVLHGGGRPPALLALEAGPGGARLTATRAAGLDRLLAGGAALLGACEQQRGGAPSWLVLTQRGAVLGLHALQPPAGAGAAPGPELLAELEHPALQRLAPDQAWLAPGPLLVLRPEESQSLLLLAPAGGGGGARGSAPGAGWELLELELSAAELLRCATAAHPGAALGCAPAAAAPAWRLLHASLRDGGGATRLLVSLPLARVGGSPDTAQQQQQQQTVLVRVDVQLGGEQPPAGAHDSAAPPRVACLHATGWRDVSACAVASCSDGTAGQRVAVGSEGGAVQLLLVTSAAATAAAGGGGGAACDLQATCDGLPGPIRAIEHLQRVHAGGAVQRDALAVLHAAGGACATLTVTLLAQQGQRLQPVAAVRGAAGLLSPAASCLAMLAPWQPAQQATVAAAVAGGALQLAAVVLLDGGAGDEPDTEGLDCMALLPAQGAADCGAPGPLLGLLAQPPPGQPQEQPEQLEQAAANELRGLQAMHAVLEARWQQESLELSALQGRLQEVHRVSMAVHQQLCQLAADRVQGSTARQLVLPLAAADDPTAPVAAYQLGRRIAAAQQQQLAALRRLQAAPGRAGGGAPCPQPGDVRLSLELLACATTLRGGALQLEVRVKPQLQLQLPDARGDVSWWGPLLQPCHAELALWHAGAAPVTSQSSWRWDGLAGELTLHAELASDGLLALAAASSSAAGGGDRGAQQAGGAAGDGAPYVGVARAIAAAAAAAAQAGTVAAAGLQLQAAVVMAASCSRQAAVQLEADAAADTPREATRAVQASQLLAPATALLHLPPVAVPLQQLLSRRLGASADAGLPASGGCGAVAAPAAGDAMRTPLRPPPAGARAGGASWPGPAAASAASAGGIDMVPPTPCSAVDDEGGLVIRDSQASEDGGDAAPTQDADARHDADAAAAPDGGGSSSGAPQAQQPGRQLLLRRQGGGLGGLLGALQRAGFVAQGRQGAAAEALQQLGAERSGGSGARAVASLAPGGGGGGTSLRLTWFSDSEVHAELAAGSEQELDALQELLLLVAHGACQGVTCEPSPLSAAAAAGHLAALDALSQAVALQCRVVEATLQQLHDQELDDDDDDDAEGGAHVPAAAGGAENVPPSAAAGGAAQKRPAPAAEGATRCGGARAGERGLVRVDGRALPRELSECWVELLRAQADAGLAISQLSQHA
ncbi:hypothetical protein HT031_005762 [Scenedesmus sp. PABB004]|nr:hypothetical protein HT031_005762 [Scenedesmus sp. PABB004]